MQEPAGPSRLAELAADLEPFRRYARAKLGREDLADEALQEALLKATRHVGDVRDESDLRAWFWTILRRAIADLVAAERSGRTRREALDAVEPAGSEAPPDACACLRAVVARLPPIHAEVLQEVDLGGAAPAEAARRLGISSGALAVRRHRARAALGEALHATCRTCARHGCLDCTCREPAR